MDDEILKTLENIEKILKGSGIFGGRSLANSATKAKDALKARFQKSDEKTFKAVAESMKDLDSTVTSLDKSFRSLDSEVGRTTSGFTALNGQMAKFMTSMQPIQMGAALTGVPNQNVRGAGAPGAAQPLRPIQPVLQQTAQNLLNLGGSTALLGVSFGKLGEAVKQMTVDFFALAGVGLGSTDSLMTLYKNAILSGVSLKRYTTLLTENVALASRAGSLERFDELTSAATKQLAVLGVFGDEAKSLQVSVGNSLTMMGISQSILTTEISKQVDVFGQLRKSTNMTAEKFIDLVKTVSENDQIQREMVGVAPEQRAARFQELLQINTTGQRLGLAADASKKLADALVAQRNETVKGRFEAAGRVRQLGAFLGMGAEGDRVAQLQMKGKNATAAETEELLRLQTSLNTAAETAYQAGGIGVQNVIDQMREGLGNTGVGKVMDASAAVELAQSSAGVFNKDFGQHVGMFGQIVGRMISLTRGALDSPLGGAAAGLGAAVAFAFRGPIFGALTKVLQTGSVAATAAMKPMSMFAGMFSGFGGTLLKTIPVLAKLIAPLSAVVELFTGQIRNALDPDGGFVGFVGGMLTSLLTAVPNLIIDGLSFVFGESFMTPIKNVFDTIIAYMNFAVKDFLAGLLHGPQLLLEKILPEDSGLIKMFKSAREGIIKSAESNADVVMKLNDDQSLTLDKIGAANEKKSAETVVQATAAADKVQKANSKLNNVQYGAAVSQSQAIQDARAFAATPQIQVPAPVAPPAAVNTPTAGAASTTTGQPQSADMVTVLQAILQMMTRSTAAEEAQVELARLMLDQNRPRAGFTSSEELSARLLKNKQGMAS